MTPVKATKEEKLLVLGDRVVGIANNLTEAGIPCKFSVVFGKFTFNLDTTRLAAKSKPSKRGKKCPNKSRRDKQRRIEFILRQKQPDLPQDAPPTDCLSTEGDAILEERGEGGSKRDEGAEMEKNDNEANGAQEEVTLQSLMETLISMN